MNYAYTDKIFILFVTVMLVFLLKITNLNKRIRNLVLVSGLQLELTLLFLSVIYWLKKKRCNKLVFDVNVSS